MAAVSFTGAPRPRFPKRRAALLRLARKSRGVVGGAFRFTSRLPRFRKDELERLLYFNENQHKVESALREGLRQYGSPTMVVGERRIHFTVTRFPSAQTLYALDESARMPRLAAAVIYTREDAETLSVIYVALHEDYVAGGPREARLLAPRLLELLRASAARTKGVRWLRLAYHPRDLRIEIRKRT